DINGLEEEIKKLTDAELAAFTPRFKERIAKGETIDDVLAEAFAVVREAAQRTLGVRHFDVQLMGGIVLHQGKIAEMKTGEGKTLTATLSLYLNALEGKGAHLVTPNDYLSRVGAGWMGPVYSFLGMSAGVITHEFSGIYDPEYKDVYQHGDERLSHFRPCTRTEAYAADITYGTNNEFGFDYLRDNLEQSAKELRQRELHYAIVDEIDSILIDEARTPLIISVPDEESGELYKVFSRIVPQLKEGADYNKDEKLHAVSLSEEGINKVEKILNIGNIYEEKGMRFVRHLESALRAQAFYYRDKQYVVKDGQVIIVDEFTGRLMPGRRWSEGLHQAVEAKEGVEIQRESRTLATITFQNYFRMYGKLAGMTGTAETSAEEFHKVYNLEVVSVPTHRAMIRDDMPDLVFQTERGKLKAVVAEVKKRHEEGQPVLIGTVSIEKNELLSKMLQIEGVPHQLLNAKNHEQEALIIAQAGSKGTVTVATNMAGRGVDIILGGSPTHGSSGASNPPDVDEAAEVRNVGGLHVIGTERHEARRIDNQLRGRAGRQGDTGSSQFFVSFEDDLMRIFASTHVKGMMERLGIPEEQAVENKMVSRAIESSQSKIEGFHFDSRKHILEFDDVLNKQRTTIYRMRRNILVWAEVKTEEGMTLSLRDAIFEMIDEEMTRMVNFHTQSGDESEWNVEEIYENVHTMAHVSDDMHQSLRGIVEGDGDSDEKRAKIIEVIIKELTDDYARHQQSTGDEQMKEIERTVMLRSMDILWMDHLDQMEHLRDSVRLRAYGQREPLVEYKNEGSKLFRELQVAIRSEIVHTIFKTTGAPAQDQSMARIEFKKPAEMMFTGPASLHAHTPEASKKINSAKQPDRNDPCPCGSGKKYKRCHGA
ncbi:MAG: preprotein translocase subunit SecA, partial [Candidatus Sungbacteria bacterium]|nr:preprotein translocase subunit SecA [Candidatus Sungbacteria bacterium]